MERKPDPLYRRVNTRTHGVRHHKGGDFRDERKTKGFARSDASRGRMRGRSDRGLDYTPLFKFLLARVGRDWDEVYAEAVARLDREEPIFWMVARRVDDRTAVVRLGHRTYFSGLFVDDRNTLQIVDATVTVEQLNPSCWCCTHTFNGVRFTRKYRPP